MEGNQVQVFYSYVIYSNGLASSYGSGTVIGEKGEVWSMAMEVIVMRTKCKQSDIHLVSFNTL